LFEPSWGIYDMAIGENIKSAYSGPADPEGFGLSYDAPEEKTHQLQYSKNDLALHHLYTEVREMRHSKYDQERFLEIWNSVKTSHPTDWLLQVEMYEIAKNNNSNGILGELLQSLDRLKAERPDVSHLIENGIR